MPTKNEEIKNKIDKDMEEYFEKREKEAIVDHICSGSSLLDIIIQNGYPLGSIINLYGLPSSGKSFLTAELLYQAMLKYGNKVIPKYLDKENGFSFNTQDLFGYNIDDYRVEGVSSIEDFLGDFGSTINKLKKDECLVYVIDSWDSLASDEDLEQYEERVKKFEKDEDYNKGSYGMAKQKFASYLFRTLSDKIKNKRVLLIIISQIRSKINAMPFESPYVISGGFALRHYSSTQLLLKRIEDFNETGEDNFDRSYGYGLSVKAMKSRSDFPNRTCYLDIFYADGINNVRSNIAYLYGLRDNRGKLIPAKCKAIQWKENAKDASSENLKAFLEEQKVMDEFKENGNRATQGKIIEFISTKPELLDPYVEEFGTMDLETLTNYIINNGLQDELAERVKKLWYSCETKIVRPRSKKLLGT